MPKYPYKQKEEKTEIKTKVFKPKKKVKKEEDEKLD
tara:strand:+ start:471 stop:578 length:108 start_codon:yes stop_codon:yes gene_type:complete